MCPTRKVVLFYPFSDRKQAKRSHHLSQFIQLAKGGASIQIERMFIIIITTGPAHRECFLPRNTDLLKPKSNTQALDIMTIMTSFAFPLSLLLLLLLLSHLVMSDSL